MSEKTAIAILLLLAMPGVVLYRYAQVRSVQGTVEKGTLLQKAMDSIDAEKPLELPKCFETAQIISLKEKGMELRRRYNIRYKLCERLREHLQDLCECGYISQAEYEKIAARIAAIEDANQELKKQFQAVTAYLEEQHARNVAQQYAESTHATLRKLEQQNDEHLRQAPLPQDGK